MPTAPKRRGHARERAAHSALGEAGVDRGALRHAVAAHHVGAGPAPLAAEADDAGRWVPIGPSVIRRGQALGRPHVTGRIRDLAVADDGTRAYAASAKGGLWYTEDAGATWEPVGAWAEAIRRTGGNTSVLTCGALLVDFGDTQLSDFVMVGTGELVPFFTTSQSGRVGGIGVLAAHSPTFGDFDGQPWEPDSGIDQLEGRGIYRLARRPGRVAGQAGGGTADEVLAATDSGLFRGVRGSLPATPANPPYPALGARDGFTWTAVAGIAAGTLVTDVAWVDTGGGDRIIVLVDGQGMEFSDDDGATFDPVPTLHRPAQGITGRMSMAIAEGNRAYILYDRNTWPRVARIPDLTATPPVATRLTGVPRLWTSSGSRDYDQAIAAETVDGEDRVYLGGATSRPTGGGFAAALYAQRVSGTRLRSIAGVSDRGLPPRAGADQWGLVGNTVHADVHVIALPGPAPAAGEDRAVWVGCDGGVYVSSRSGRVNSFASANTGLAVAETGFIDGHPLASQFLATGLQDNGVAIRTGDTVWEVIHLGDGGGVAFAPTSPDTMVAQYIRGYWQSEDANFRDPLTRTSQTPSGINGHPEYGAARAEFYSNCAAVRVPGVAPNPDTTRFAVGTDRVYLSSDLGSGAPQTWTVLDVAADGTAAAARDPHPSATAADQQFGVVGGGYGRVVSLGWVSPTELVVVYQNGIIRQVDQGGGTWQSDHLLDPNNLPPAPPPPPPTPAPFPTAPSLTEVAAVPGSRDFYVTTFGHGANPLPDTCYFFNATTGTFHPTGLRRELDPAAGVLGPRDPAYSVVVDPGSTGDVYVGTATGVWHGQRTDAVGGHTWTHFVNGLPEATVQDLTIWTDPSVGPASGPRLLRAAIQSRGVWETDLAADTPPLTYLRAHAHDDRRGTIPAVNPRSSALPLTTIASPDIVVRPAWPAAAAPAFPQVVVGTPDAPLTSVNAGAYHTWVFQTAFRWVYPSVRADGQWTDAFGDLVRRERHARGLSAGRSITRELWDAVVGGTRLATTPQGRLEVSADAADPLAVFRPPWHTALAPEVPATEVDLMECVVAPSQLGATWQVPAAASVVEVLLHHRASDAAGSFTTSVGLMWKVMSGVSIPLFDPAQGFVDWWDAASDLVSTPVAAPAGWTVVPNAAAEPVHTLGEDLGARIPKAVPIPLDLTGQAGTSILLVAFSRAVAGGDLAPTPAGATDLVSLVNGWPHCAMRLIQVV